MSANQQLSFLQEKIGEIGSAIFFNLSDSVLKLPTSIVSTLKVDDYGYVWFFVKKPHQQLKEFEPEFPVRLDFFKKGVDHFLQIMGKGWVVNDPEQLSTFISFNNDVTPVSFEEYVLVKVKMLKAEYYETHTRIKTTWWQNAMKSIFTWFNYNNNSYGPTTYFPAPQN